MQNFGEAPNHYETLEVSRDCTTNQLKEAFELKTRQNEASSPQSMEQVHLAFNTLKDSDSRKSYDAMLFQKEINDARAIKALNHLDEERQLDNPSYYDLLHLPPNMTHQEILWKYNYWLRRKELLSIRERRAFSILLTPHLRADYDAQLACQEAEKMCKQREQQEQQERDEAIAKAKILEQKKQLDINLQEAQLQLKQQEDEKRKRWMEANPQYFPHYRENPLVAYSGVGEFIGDVAELPVFIVSLYVQAPIAQCVSMMSSCDFSIDEPPMHLICFMISPIAIAMVAAKQAVIVPARVGITLGGLFCARTASSAPEVQTLLAPGV